ncbi:MAG: hypothetical protein AB1324_01140 [Candidatus Micrarchaeota archaeon]
MQYAVASSLIVMTILSCCGTSGVSAYCGDDDYSCFAGYAENGCQPVQMKTLSDVSVRMEIVGEDGYGDCEIKMTALSRGEFKQDLVSDMEMTETEAETMLAMMQYQNIEGKSATCYVAPQKVFDFLAYGDGAETCSGPLIDAYMSVAR